ncbi:MAG: SBBP repeat-containing protein, partial [Verrucomicrobiota bacterium]
MKISFYHKLFLCAVALAMGILGDTTAQAQRGGVPVWTNSYNGPGNSGDQARAMAVDTSGNVFVTGESWSGSSDDYATIKYSGAGVALWTNRYNGPGNSDDYAEAMAVDTSGNVFVTGDSLGTNLLSDYATIAYSGAGVALWTNRYNGPENNRDQAGAVVVDGSGNVFVTGRSVGSGSDYDYATIKYSGAGVAL